VKFGMETDHKLTYKFYTGYCFKPEDNANFEVIYDKYDFARMCISGMHSSQKNEINYT
jgi:hypothetical protein